MADPVVVGVGLVLLLLGLLAWRRARDQARVVQLVRDLPVTPVGGVNEGLQRVRGKLESDLPLKSPFQGRECLYYFFRVTTPREGKTPRTVATGKEWTIGQVRDESGVAALEPWTPAVGSPRRFETVLRGLTAIPPDLAKFFERAGIDEKHLPRLPVMTVHEYTLEPGDEVYVLGTPRVEEGARTFHRAKRRPYAISSEEDIGLLRGLRNEQLIHAVVAPMLLLAGCGVVVLGLLA